MTEEVFLAKMTDILEVEEPVTMETVLPELEEWDSLAHVSVISFAKAVLGKKVTVPELKTVNTVADLYNILKA